MARNPLIAKTVNVSEDALVRLHNLKGATGLPIAYILSALAYSTSSEVYAAAARRDAFMAEVTNDVNP